MRDGGPGAPGGLMRDGGSGRSRLIRRETDASLD
jgi:hypothetical protein